jgi:hypothetical protein
MTCSKNSGSLIKLMRLWLFCNLLLSRVLMDHKLVRTEPRMIFTQVSAEITKCRYINTQVLNELMRYEHEADKQ